MSKAAREAQERKEHAVSLSVADENSSQDSGEVAKRTRRHTSQVSKTTRASCF